jgi:hypothetical protein
MSPLGSLPRLAHAPPDSLHGTHSTSTSPVEGFYCSTALLFYCGRLTGCSRARVIRAGAPTAGGALLGVCATCATPYIGRAPTLPSRSGSASRMNTNCRRKGAAWRTVRELAQSAGGVLAEVCLADRPLATTAHAPACLGMHARGSTPHAPAGRRCRRRPPTPPTPSTHGRGLVQLALQALGQPADPRHGPCPSTTTMRGTRAGTRQPAAGRSPSPACHPAPPHAPAGRRCRRRRVPSTAGPAARPPSAPRRSPGVCRACCGGRAQGCAGYVRAKPVARLCGGGGGHASIHAFETTGWLTRWCRTTRGAGA